MALRVGFTRGLLPPTEPWQAYDCGCLECVDQFGENYRVNSIESSSPRIWYISPFYVDFL